MERTEVAAILARRPDCRSVDRAMSIVSQGLDLAAVLKGGTEADIEKAWREYPHASRIVVLARGQTRIDDRLGVFIEPGKEAPMLF